ncbi:aldolase catalytic domain-containing protein [Neptuniibacter sp. QD48_11]|uniref:aldolase catalytic domain-containing protein n=1 Tax=Neptuniibacter sp. QD48_11 TaxID=3398211 RepID=UPI0039F52368
MKILDCTLRDGGYYNNWDFDQDTVQEYLSATAEAGVDLIELGLRNFPGSGFRGAYYFTTEAHIADLKLPPGPKYGVMIDAKTILNSDMSIEDAIQTLFVGSNESQLEFVRIACHFNEVDSSKEIAESLKKLGYCVFINVMQISLRSDEEIRQLSELLSNWSCIDGLYFADSLGNMDADDINRVVKQIRLHWKRELGIHAHNNMGLALSNALYSIDLGVSHIDVTITGMGRGAGNAETELLLLELESAGNSSYKASALAELVFKCFEPIKKKLGWGASLHYFMAAKYNIHPTYIQKILTDNHFGVSERIAAIKNLAKLAGKTSYNESYLSDLISPPAFKNGLLDKSIKDIRSYPVISGQTAILIGAGEGVSRHLRAIQRYIGDSRCKVYSVNTGIQQLDNYIDGYFVSHNVKQIDYSKFSASGGDIFAPLKRLSDTELQLLNLDQLFNFPISIEAGKFEASLDGCKIPYELTAGYALAALIALGFKRIYLVGFDGYGYADSRQKEMSELFYLVRKEYPSIEIIALTPTTYPVSQESVYAPII